MFTRKCLALTKTLETCRGGTALAWPVWNNRCSAGDRSAAGEWPAGFRNKHLAEALSVSRARASQVLGRRILSGEPARTRKGNGEYIRRPDHAGSFGRSASRTGRRLSPSGITGPLRDSRFLDGIFAF